MKPHGTRRVYEGRVINLRVDEIDARGGGTRPIEVVEHGGGAVVIASPRPGEIVLVRQHRHAVDADLWEVPAGMLERGEEPAVAALRELREETGYRAERVRPLFTSWATPGFCGERWHFFLAEELRAGEPEPDAHEDLRTEIRSIEEAWSLVETDRLRDAKTQIAIAWARIHLPAAAERAR